jgi:sugar lactone lactonase YvrE
MSLGAGYLEVVLDAGASLGEGPIWDGRRERLVWVDIDACLVHAFDPATGRDESFDAGQEVGAVAPRAEGGLVLALRDGFGVCAEDGTDLSLVTNIEADLPRNRMNDGKVDTAGRFWAGTMSPAGQTSAGALYRLDSDFRVARMLAGVTISNGIGWSPDDHRMYYTDSPSLGVDVFDYDARAGTIERRRRLISFDPPDGQPDGLTVDSQGFLWVALWGGSAVHRYAPDGRFECRIELPVSQVTSCCFGGPDLETLFITTAACHLSEADLAMQTHAGSLFACEPGVRGLPATLFAG